MSYPTDAQAREEIIRVGRLLYEEGLNTGTDGNISCRVGGGAHLWTTGSGSAKGFLTEDGVYGALCADGHTGGGGQYVTLCESEQCRAAGQSWGGDLGKRSVAGFYPHGNAGALRTDSDPDANAGNTSVSVGGAGSGAACLRCAAGPFSSLNGIREEFVWIIGFGN